MDGFSATRAEEWLVSEQAFNAARLNHSASIFSLSNGIMGVRGGLAERPEEHATVLVGGFIRLPLTYHEAFPGYALSTDTRLLGPGITGMRLTIDGNKANFTAAHLLETQCQLDLKTAALTQQSRWKLADGKEIELASWRLVPLVGRAICIARHTITPINFTGVIHAEFPIEMAPQPINDGGDPRISARARFRPVSEDGDAQRYEARFVGGLDGEVSLAAVQRLSIVSPHNGTVNHRFIQAECAAGSSLIVNRQVELKLGANVDFDPPADFSALIDRHNHDLSSFWNDVAFDLPDDPKLAAAIRFDMLQLYLSASRCGEFGTAAKGLSGEGYEGHSFWDNEVFVAPVLALTRPELARHAITWRIARLDKARANARSIGHPRGALFPWRTIAGEECSAHYPTGAAQYHVNAAIAYALEIYLRVTGDNTVLHDGGAELLVETARLWMDVGHFSDRRGGAFLIHGVTGPDEYTALVDNDFYTNAMARRHLLFAAKVVDELAAGNPGLHRQLAQAVALNGAEVADWRMAAERMWLPVDGELGVHPQDDTFLDKPLFQPRAASDDPHAPQLMRVHPMVLFRHRVSKQGDVVQAHVTAAFDASLAQIARDLAYYEPLTTHDSTLSMTAFACCAAWLGQSEKSLTHWRQTALVDLDNLHGNSDHGLHMAAMAGSWQVLAHGWAGLRLDSAEPWLTPRCPAGWTGYAFRFRWRGSLINVAVTPETTTYTLLDGPQLTIYDHGRAVALSDAAPSMVSPPQIKAVIFDLDGVLTDTAEAHYRAWKRLADEHGIAFDRTVNEGLKGVDRANSLRRILGSAGVTVSDQTFEAMLAQKNGYYVDSIASFSPADVCPGVISLLRDCRRAGLKIGLASASRNAAVLIERLGLARWFDHITDSAKIFRGKPDPEIFLETARALGVAHVSCVGVEDARAGIAAIRGAGMIALGVGGAEHLSDADRVFPAIGSIHLSDVIGWAGRNAPDRGRHTQLK